MISIRTLSPEGSKMKGIGFLVASLLCLTSTALRADEASEASLCDRIAGRGPGAEQARSAAKSVIMSRAGSAAAAFLNGCIAFGDRRSDKAADFFEFAASSQPRSLYFDWLGRAYGEQAQRANKLKQPFLARKTKLAFEKAVDLDPANLEARNYLASFYQMAPGMLGGSEVRAREQIQAIRERNAYRGALANAGFLARAKDLAGAERELEALTRSHPDSLAPWSSLAQLQINAGRWADAFRTADNMRARHRNGAMGDYTTGRIAALSGQQLERGEAALRRYLTTSPAPGEPTLASAHFRLGQILQLRKETDAARTAYQRVLTLQPDHEDAKKALAGLR
jgi:tetratricopeptide (TPR) repeat protein